MEVKNQGNKFIHESWQRRAKKEGIIQSDDFKFLPVCFFLLSAGYLIFIDRSLPLSAIWNVNLCFLAGPFIFGIIYELEFFTISFWLLLGLVLADLIFPLKASKPGIDGENYLTGLVVLLLVVPAGLAGCGFSFLFHKINKSPESIDRKAS